MFVVSAARSMPSGWGVAIVAVRGTVLRKKFRRSSPIDIKQAIVAETDQGAQPISQVPLDAQRRLTTEIPELDRVLGGGLVPGSLVLVGGDPHWKEYADVAGGRMAQSGQRLLYVSGEESAVQTRLRADRLGVGPRKSCCSLEPN